MDIVFLFDRHSVTDVARAAGVDSGTASKWKSGKQRPDWTRVCRLYARGMLTDADLRAAGLAIPLVSERGDILPAAPAALVPVVDSEAIPVEDRQPLDALKAVAGVAAIGFVLGLLS